MQISSMITMLAGQLIDPGFVRWKEGELLDYINQALSIIAVNLPDEFRHSETVSVTQAEVTLPADAVALLSVDGVNGVAVSEVAVEKLNQLDPDWRQRLGVPSSWVQNVREKQRYWLYPAPSEPVHVTHTYSAFTYLGHNDDLPVSDVYQSAVMDFVLHRAYGKDGQNASEQNKSLMHLQLFNVAIGNVLDLKGLLKQERAQREKQR